MQPTFLSGLYFNMIINTHLFLDMFNLKEDRFNQEINDTNNSEN